MKNQTGDAVSLYEEAKLLGWQHPLVRNPTSPERCGWHLGLAVSIMRLILLLVAFRIVVAGLFRAGALI